MSATGPNHLVVAPPPIPPPNHLLPHDIVSLPPPSSPPVSTLPGSNPIPSSPPLLADSNPRAARDADRDKASDSEAETIIDDEKNGSHSSKLPSVPHAIKNEDTGHAFIDPDGLDSDIDAPGDIDMEDPPPPPPPPPPPVSLPTKSKTKQPKKEPVDRTLVNGLGSAPTSPYVKPSSNKRDAGGVKKVSSPQSPPKDRARMINKPRKRKHSEEDSDDDGRSASSTPRHHQDPKDRRETRSNTARPSSPKSSNPRDSRDRSHSPRPRTQHRRAASIHSHLSLTNGQGSKRRRIPPPLHSSHRDKKLSDGAHSDSSDLSDSRQSSRPRKSAGTDASALSPAKMPPHKKLRDQIGRTQLARACANGEQDQALLRLKDRPQDIDEADYAGNTPLQIASLAGSVEIVKLLIDHGCDVTCKNKEKDTPLIDAVENTHVEVARLLLFAGANPKQGNAKGEEPLDLLNEDADDYEEMRKLLLDAIKQGTPRRISEDHAGNNATTPKDTNSRSSRGASAHSPRHSPPVSASKSPPPIAFPPRRRNARSEVSRNDLLWMSASVERLRELAGKGDLEGVGRILGMRPQSDTESFIAAARGGHDEVMQLLLAMGDAEPDPAPIKSSTYKTGYNTPMLAAIGRGSEKVIKLLLEQQVFDPTRLDHKGRTYHEVAKERQGFGWEKEYELLKAAYDKHPKSRKSRLASGKNPSSSPDHVRREREKDRDQKRALRHESSLTLGGKIKRNKSPSHRPSEAASGKQSKRSSTDSVASKPEKTSKAAVEQLLPKRLDSSAVSDGEPSALDPPRPKVRRSESDSGKPRRKLVSGKVLKGDQERARRISKSDGEGEEKEETTAKALKSMDRDKNHLKSKSDDSRNRLEVVRNQVASKRTRDSVSPQGSSSHDSDSRRVSDDIKKKRRRIDSDGHDVNSKRTSALSNGSQTKSKDDSTKPTKSGDGAAKVSKAPRKDGPSTSTKPAKSRRSASPDDGHKDISNQTDTLKMPKKREMETPAKPIKEDPEVLKAKQEQARQEQLEKEHQLQIQREQAEELASKIKREEEEERLRQERAAKEEAERQAQLAAERAKKEEAERTARIAREEQEAAAERKRREEEAQRRRVEQEQRRREEAERRRREAEQRERDEQLRRQQEEEQRRIAALPNRLRWQAEKPIHLVRTAEEARSFLPLFTATLAEIDPSLALQSPSLAPERYIANFQAAPVLGEKDLALSQFTAWSKSPFTADHSQRMWAITGANLAGGYAPPGQSNSTRRSETQAKYNDLSPKFWIRVVDFEDMVPRYPHLAQVKLRYIKTCLTHDFSAKAGSDDPATAYPPRPVKPPMQEFFEELDKDAPDLPYQDRKKWNGSLKMRNGAQEERKINGVKPNELTVDSTKGGFG
ncbi:MAG: Set3 complex subunit with deacetylase activity, meiotic-specific repressor of sporulation proteins [Vezdaea aestivalis]|nr:MAG: Set3 complex subunit with deacetylase activity, meiotic-specific repressor of sporulation proteins [Vezdaea aestivalis]